MIPFLPHTCVLCDADAENIDLCTDCRMDLPWIDKRCLVCGLPSETTSWEICPRCRRKPRPFSAVVAPLSYRFPIDAMIVRFKQHRQLAYGQVLGELLAEHALKRLDPICHDSNLIAPIPLHPARQRRRGFNQALILARVLSQYVSWPLLPNLCRRRNEGQQVKNQRLAGRAHAVKGVFSVEKNIRNRRIIVVDDVVTSCATATEFSHTLLAAGAADVVILAVARTPSNALC